MRRTKAARYQARPSVPLTDAGFVGGEMSPLLLSRGPVGGEAGRPAACGRPCARRVGVRRPGTAPRHPDEVPWRAGTSSSAAIWSRQKPQIPCAIGGSDDPSNRRVT